MAQYLLESDKTLFLFDGLDEVADEGMRSRLFEAVADLMQAYKAPRIVVTSRPYAFRRSNSLSSSRYLSTARLARLSRSNGIARFGGTS